MLSVNILYHFNQMRVLLVAVHLIAFTGLFHLCQGQSYDIAAFYFGNWHVDPLNEQVHGTNWTEWNLIKEAKPRFQDHPQPKIPTWGFEMEDDPKAFQRKVDAAAENHVNVFLFDWYWHQKTGPFLNGALEDGYMKTTGNAVKFAIMWANHDWEDIHPAKAAWLRQLNLYPGAVDRPTFDDIVDHTISTYFKDPRYYTVNGCPFYSIYQLYTLVDGLGGLDATKSALDSFRDRAKNAGIPCIHFNAIDMGVNNHFPDPDDALTQLQFSSVTSYCWIHNVSPYVFPVTPYSYMLDNSVKYWTTAATSVFPSHPYIPNVSVGWDPSPRACQSDTYENQGYPFTATFWPNGTSDWQEALSAVKSYLDGKCDPHWCMFTINAWNEWSEGSYLEPDQIYGDGNLKAIKTVFG